MTIDKLRVIGFSLLPLHIIGFILTFMYIGTFEAICGTGFFGIVSIIIYHFSSRNLRIKFINEYQFPSIVLKKFSQEYNRLNEKEINMVINALKQFFMIYCIAVVEHKVPKKGFIMPSKMVDELWHNFMLDSRHYEKFCTLAFGRTLHHKPGENTKGNKNLKKLTNYSDELKNTYKHLKDLNQYQSVAVLAGIPLLFAIDKHFNVEDGFYYDQTVLNNINLLLHKPSESSDSSGCAGIFDTDTSSGSDSGGSDSNSSCGGGCGD